MEFFLFIFFASCVWAAFESHREKLRQRELQKQQERQKQRELQELLSKSVKYNSLNKLLSDLSYYEAPILLTLSSLREFRMYDKTAALSAAYMEIRNKYKFLSDNCFHKRFSEISSFRASTHDYVKTKEEEIQTKVSAVMNKPVEVMWRYVSPAGMNCYTDSATFTFAELQEYLEHQRVHSLQMNTEQYRRERERQRLTPGLRYDILKRDNFRCQICGRTQADGVKLEVDHKKPIAKGGKTEPGNLWTLCQDCNRGKSAKYTEADDVQIEPQREEKSAMHYGEFLKLCALGNAPRVEAAINDGANVNTKNEYGTTALIYAARNGHTNVAGLLVENGADVNAKDDDDWTALMWASLRGYIKATELLINHGANVNAKSKHGRTALMLASLKSHNEVTELLINRGANVNVKTNGGWTALMLASSRGHTETADILRKYGAEVVQKQPETQQRREQEKATNQRSPALSDKDFVALCKSGDARRVEEAINNSANVNAKNEYGTTALMEAVRNGQTEIAELLLKHGADVNARGFLGWTALMYLTFKGHTETAELLLKHGADVNARDNNGETALMFAAQWGRTDIANLLRRYGAEVVQKQPETQQQREQEKATSQRSPALSDNEFLKLCESGYVRSIEEAISNGANVDAKNEDGWTALMQAAWAGKSEIAELLLKHGADVNARNKYGTTALMVAAAYDKTETAELLLKHGADVIARRNDGKTALRLARNNKTADLLRKYGTEKALSDKDFVKLCKSCDARSVEEAVRNGANVNARDKDSITALMCAAAYGHTETAELLMRYGADVNARNDVGETALMYAAYGDYTETAELLLKHGADVNAKNKYNNTALIYATHYGHTETAELLLKHGADVNAKSNDGYTALMWARNSNTANLLRSYGAKE